MERPNKLLLFGLLAAIGAYLMSRTKTGEAIAQEVVEAGASAAEAVSHVFTGSRGIRNNNPGNIDRKPGTVWRGMSADQSGDSRFVVFDAPEWGIRAMARIIRNYRLRGLSSVRQIINAWAPPSENDTGSYVAAVAGRMGVPADAALSPYDVPALIAAIIQHENGQQPYPPDLIALGVELEHSA